MDTSRSIRVRERLLELTQDRYTDTRALREDIVAVLRRAVPFDAWCWACVDPETLLLASGVGDSPAAADIVRFIDLEYGAPDGSDRMLASTGGRGPATSVLSEITGGDLLCSARWREVYERCGVGDELRVALVADGYCWGLLEMVRDRTGRHFTADEADFVLRLGTPMARALRSALTAVSSPATDAPWDPGILVLDRRGTIGATTPEADAWLALIHANAIPIEALFPAPAAVLAVAARLRSTPEGPGPVSTGAESSPRVRVRMADGHWLAVHATRLTGTATPPGSVAVTIQAAGVADVAPLVFHAHGLTPRQRELARLLLAGLPNSEIARQLYISPHTVGDHVKAVLDKLGVHSKRELVAGILSQQL